MILRKGYKYRLKTNFSHNRRLRVFAGHCRFVWNKALALQLARLESRLPLLSYQDLAGLLRLWKQSEEFGACWQEPAWLARCQESPSLRAERMSRLAPVCPARYDTGAQAGEAVAVPQGPPHRLAQGESG